MWKKIIELRYLTLARYCFLGIILAVIVFQFVTKSMHNLELDFSSLIEKEIIAYIVSALIGGLVGGLVFILFLVNRNAGQIKDRTLWIKLKGKHALFFIKNIAVLSIGGFVYKLIINLFDLTSYDNLIESLFSRDYIIGYLGVILAMTVFSILLSIGIMKRLNLLYGKLKKN
jgi:hypothetical protein